MRIGDFEPSSPFFLCPLAGFTDLSFRRMARSLSKVGQTNDGLGYDLNNGLTHDLNGLGLAYTELVNPVGLERGSPRSLQIVETSPDDKPLAVQLYGVDIRALCDAAVWAAERGSPVVDLNMGCPVPKIAGKGGGSGILRNCPDAVALASAVVKACPVPVTVKTRLGWGMGDLVAPNLVRQLEDVGVAAVTIHGRYGEQRFSGVCDRSAIARVVEAARRIPVIGNGDVHSASDALAMMKETGCQGVMIGRRALADPWIFRDALALYQGRPSPPPPTRRERIARMQQHFGMMVERLGEHRGVVEFRKRISWWAKGLTPCPNLRRNGPTIASVEQFNALAEEMHLEADRWDENQEPARILVGEADDV